MSIDEDYLVMMLEDMNGKFDIVIEGVGQLQDSVKTRASQDSLDRVETKVDTVQTALTDTNKDIVKLDARVTVLEQA